MKNFTIGILVLFATTTFSCGSESEFDDNNAASDLGCVDGGTALEGDSTIIIWDGNLCITNGVRVNLLKDLGTRTKVSELTKIGPIYYFVSQDEAHGDELWKSDGTKKGTMMVKDIRTGVADSQTHALTNVNGTLFFVASQIEEIHNLWKSDGTEAGTIRVKEIFPGDSQGPGELTEMGGNLYFRAADSVKGIELWVSDGTEEGTQIVKNIQPDEPNDIQRSSSFPTNLISNGNTLFFRVASDDPNFKGFDLWKTDGTEANTVLVRRIESTSNIPSIGDEIIINDIIYFMVKQDDKEIRELWTSDGTAIGTKKLKDISADSGFLQSEFTEVKDLLFFRIVDNTKGLAELWKSDGTETGTVVVRSLSKAPENLTSVNDMLFFVADSDGTFLLLWKTDGTEAGTQPLGDGVERDVQILGSLKNTLIFGGEAKERIGMSNDFLWKTDGSETGTEHVAHR